MVILLIPAFPGLVLCAFSCFAIQVVCLIKRIVLTNVEIFSKLFTVFVITCIRSQCLCVNYVITLLLFHFQCFDTVTLLFGWQKEHPAHKNEC